jgi:arginyl-tRNA synthetase
LTTWLGCISNLAFHQQQFTFYNMPTVTTEGIEELLKDLGLKPLPHVPGANTLNKPLDIGRAYLADILSSLVDCDNVAAYNSIQWPGGISSGDLAVILPKLSHGADPNVLAFDLKVRRRR